MEGRKFESLEQKRDFVNQQLKVGEDRMLTADKNWNQFYYKEAHASYIQAIEAYMELIKITGDDPNFQQFLRGKMEYLMDRAEKCKTYLSTQMQSKHQAGYFKNNVNNESMDFLRQVL